MFQGTLEAALGLYSASFPGCVVKTIERQGPNEAGPEGSTKRAEVTIAGQTPMCFDSPMKHDFTLTPSFSLFVQCESEAELDAAFSKLSDGGSVLMPPGN
jgi:predicted 3-demethylubiquinone-9 3-methyltransferase (glyoxalase superfamily)